MRNNINYDLDTFDKVLLKIKTLLEQGNLEVIPEFERDCIGRGSKYMEFYNETIRVPIEIFVNALNDEIWEIQIISISDGSRRYHGRANVDGNSTACEIYRIYKESIEKPKIDIDEYVDRLFDWSRCSE